MAVVTLIQENKTFTDDSAIRQCLQAYGIDYERWKPSHELPADASADEVL